MICIVRAGYGRPAHAAYYSTASAAAPNSMPLHMGQRRSAGGLRPPGRGWNRPAASARAAPQISTQLWVLTVDGMELSEDTGVPPEIRVRS